MYIVAWPSAISYTVPNFYSLALQRWKQTFKGSKQFKIIRISPTNAAFKYNINTIFAIYSIKLISASSNEYFPKRITRRSQENFLLNHRTHVHAGFIFKTNIVLPPPAKTKPMSTTSVMARGKRFHATYAGPNTQSEQEYLTTEGNLSNLLGPVRHCSI
jgi:hypothetical protein